MTTTVRPVDVTRAQIARGADGSVTVDDGGPWLLRLWPHPDPRTGRPRIGVLQVEVRDQGDVWVDVTAARLGRLPMHQLRLIADGKPHTAHPNEDYYQMLATPKAGRVWDDGHWDRVLSVFAWAQQTGRPGGGRQAVADLWHVALSPTVDRWLSRARHRPAKDEAPA